MQVQIDSYIIDADNPSIRNRHVSAQLLGQLSKLSLYDFSTNVYWVWQIASTTGDVETMRYTIGSTENKGHSTDKKSITWFVESRSWSKVLSTSKTGSVTRGSKASLITALQTGSPLRLVVHETTDSYSIIEADNIAIENSEVAAKVIRKISDENGIAEIPRRFKSPAYWQFTSVNRWNPAGCLVEGRGTLVNPSYYRELPSGLDNLLIFKFVFPFLSLQLT